MSPTKKQKVSDCLFGMPNTQIAERLLLLRKAFSHSRTISEEQILLKVADGLLGVVINPQITQEKG